MSRTINACFKKGTAVYSDRTLNMTGNEVKFEDGAYVSEDKKGVK